jgi:hypothetical protein
LASASPAQDTAPGKGGNEIVDELAKLLERFNRKERNLLIREALGHSPATPLRLSHGFRKEIAKGINCNRAADKQSVEIPENAWWATDYHISWLAGALALFVQGKCDLEKRYENPEIYGRRLVEGNQQDVDLVIATGRDLIFIEAKAYGWFTNKEMKSKVDRLNLLYAFYKEMGLRKVGV